MTPEADKLVVREWCGSFDESNHNVLYDQLGSGYLVALSVLRQRLAELTCGPAKASVDGDYAEDYASTIELLRSQILELEGIVASLGLATDLARGVLSTATVSHAGPRWR